MNSLKLQYENIRSWVTEEQIEGLQPQISQLHDDLEKGQGLGNDFLGWLHGPSQMSDDLMRKMQDTAKAVRDQCEVFICIGIGGSYLGTQAALTYCGSTFQNQLSPEERKGPEVYFAGHNISSDYLSDLIQQIEGRDICLNVISKSGTTTEPAIAFRILKRILETKYGKSEAARRIVVTTDASKGALREMTRTSGYNSFVIPNDVGGRYSVLTPVGLLPLAVAGMDIEGLLEGARQSETLTTENCGLEKNPAYLYAAIRRLLYLSGKTTEIMAAFHPSLKYVLEWWKQLSGESEGKNNQGIFPASVEYTTDLHSMGQWVQEGTRTIFETFLWVENSRQRMDVPLSDEDGDGLNYLAGKSLDHVNRKAYEGTALAHREGGVPNMTWLLPDRSEFTLGQLFYFFERTIALSGYLMNVNPFDQPGVEFYKKNMFQLLNKPGFKKGKE